MSGRDKNGKEMSIEMVAKRLARVLLARRDIHGAETLAKQDNVPFDRELALKQIEAMLGKEEADATRYRWSLEAEAERFRRFSEGGEIGLRLAAMDRALSKFTTIWKWSADQLAESVKAVDRQTSGKEAVASTSAFTGLGAATIEGNLVPLVTPLITSVDGKLSLLLLFAASVQDIPQAKDAVHLYIDGTPIETFEMAAIEEKGKRFLDISVPPDLIQSQRNTRMECEVRCKPDDLSEVGVVLTTAKGPVSKEVLASATGAAAARANGALEVVHTHNQRVLCDFQWSGHGQGLRAAAMHEASSSANDKPSTIVWMEPAGQKLAEVRLVATGARTVLRIEAGNTQLEPEAVEFRYYKIRWPVEHVNGEWIVVGMTQHDVNEVCRRFAGSDKYGNRFVRDGYEVTWRGKSSC